MIIIRLFHISADNINMTYLLIGLAAIAIIILLAIFTDKLKKSGNSSKKAGNSGTKTKKTGPNGEVLMVECPLCNTPLQKGQNLISKVFRPMDVPDQRCNISGCPHCYPQPEPGIKRICPCCGKEVPITGYLVARLFNYKDNKKHVRVTGCSRCCERK